MQADLSIPPVTWEKHTWSRDPSRRLHSDADGTYLAAVPPHIAAVEPVLPSPRTSLLTQASVALARFDTDASRHSLPLAHALLRAEAMFSSRIESIHATTRAVAQAELGNTRKRAAVETVGNISAMEAAGVPVDAPYFSALHHALMGDRHPRIPGGVVRTGAVWIGGHTPLTAVFVPPASEHLTGMLDDLAMFLQRTDLPVLTQAALAHAQFETIHPYPDGNGRTGRALVHAVLRDKGLTENITVPLSGHLYRDIRGYIAALTAYREGDAGPICDLFATAVIEAVRHSRVLVASLTDLHEQWVQTISPRKGSATAAVLRLLIGHPVVNTVFLQQHVGLSGSAAHRAVEELRDAGLVTEFSGMRRNRWWRSDETLTILDDFVDQNHTLTSV